MNIGTAHFSARVQHCFLSRGILQAKFGRTYVELYVENIRGTLIFTLTFVRGVPKCSWNCGHTCAPRVLHVCCDITYNFANLTMVFSHRFMIPKMCCRCSHHLHQHLHPITLCSERFALFLDEITVREKEQNTVLPSKTSSSRTVISSKNRSNRSEQSILCTAPCPHAQPLEALPLEILGQLVEGVPHRLVARLQHAELPGGRALLSGL